MFIANQMQQILASIAKRKGVGHNNWYSRRYVWNGPTIQPYEYRCHLCGKEWEELDHDILHDHGIQHLKEYNLLPFI